MSFNLDQSLDNSKDLTVKWTYILSSFIRTSRVKSNSQGQKISKNLENYIKHHMQIISFQPCDLLLFLYKEFLIQELNIWYQSWFPKYTSCLSGEQAVRDTTGENVDIVKIKIYTLDIFFVTARKS